MMSRKLLAPVPGLFAAIFVFPSAAMAGGPYVGASMVMSKVEVDIVPYRSFDSSSGAIHGGWRFGSQLALEAGFAWLAKEGGSLCPPGNACIPETGTFKFGARRADLALLAALPLGESVELLGKAGVGRVKTSYTVTPWESDQPQTRDRSSGTVGVFGAGLGWHSGLPVSLRLLVDWHEGAGSDARTIWIGANYSFGR